MSRLFASVIGRDQYTAVTSSGETLHVGGEGEEGKVREGGGTERTTEREGERQIRG